MFPIAATTRTKTQVQHISLLTFTHIQAFAVGLWFTLGFLSLCLLFASAARAQPVELVLEEGVSGYQGTRDNTIYEESTNTNGGGQNLFAGRTLGTLGALSRRALIAFDLSQIPPGSVILSASLQLTVSKTQPGLTTQSLHRLSKDWGEGTQDAPDPEGRGTTPVEGDATWVSNFHNISLWTSPGGDFVAGPTASTSVGAMGMTATWSGAQLAADIQQWVDGGADNFGWVLIGDEVTTQSAKAFHSSESTTATAGQRPRLTVIYEPPQLPTPTPMLPPTSTPSPTPEGPTSTPTPLVGDLNGDGKVDADDLFLFMQDWHHAAQMTAP